MLLGFSEKYIVITHLIVIPSCVILSHIFNNRDGHVNFCWLSAKCLCAFFLETNRIVFIKQLYYRGSGFFKRPINSSDFIYSVLAMHNALT